VSKRVKKPIFPRHGTMRQSPSDFSESSSQTYSQGFFFPAQFLGFTTFSRVANFLSCISSSKVPASPSQG
jgi:hypothetical protein